MPAPSCLPRTAGRHFALPLLLFAFGASTAMPAADATRDSTFIPVRGTVVLNQPVAGKPLRSSAGAPPNGTTLGNLLKIEALQNHRARPVVCQYDKAIWSGLSWAVGEVRHRDLDPACPITIRCSSLEKQPVELDLECYAVSYD